jgi:hypothetical protein
MIVLSRQVSRSIGQVGCELQQVREPCRRRVGNFHAYAQRLADQQLHRLVGHDHFAVEVGGDGFAHDELRIHDLVIIMGKAARLQATARRGPLDHNGNQDKADSLETMILIRTLPGSLPVFTISDIHRFRSERDYVETLVAKLVEYLMDGESVRGAGRLYLP